MPEAGSTFTDWQQVDRDSLLFVDDDFGWSEPPRRRRITGTADSAPRSGAVEPVYAPRRTAVLDYNPAPVAPERDWDQPTATHSHFDELMEEWNAAYGDGAARDAEQHSNQRAFDLSDPGDEAASQGARRTVLITGHGDERYLPAPRRRRASELRFHERSSFSPDRAGLWAVLLGIALVIGCVAH